MNPRSHTVDDTIPFPPLPTTREVTGCKLVKLRRFGVCEADFGVDFGGPRPLIIKGLLRLCARDAEDHPPSESFIDGLELGKRTECLLALAMAGQPERELIIQCPYSDCGKDMELVITFAELAGLQHEVEAIHPVMVSVDHDELTLKLRRPTGSDQAAWSAEIYRDHEDAMASLTQRLLEPESRVHFETADAGVRRSWLAAIAEVLSETDPLVDFGVWAACPHCEREARHPFDLENFALEELAAMQTRLLKEVHRIAAFYHWDERTILALPHWRRTAYLNLIKQEKAAGANEPKWI